MVNYKISIVIPVYNARKFIKQAMDSLLKQTIRFENLQVIMINDCSTDNSGQILDAYKQKYTNVVVEHLSENSGSDGPPRNVAFKYIEAPFIMFLDADDYYPNDACAFLYKAITDSNVDAVSGYRSSVDMNRNILQEKQATIGIQDGRTLHFPQDYSLIMPYHGGFANKIYKSSIINNNKIYFSSLKAGADTLFLFEYYLNCSSMQYYNHLVYYYRDNADSMVHNISYGFILALIECLEQIKYLFFKYEKKEMYKDWLESSTELDGFALRILRSDIVEKSMMIEVLSKAKDIFDYAVDNHVTCKTPYGNIFVVLESHKSYEMLVDCIFELRKIRSYELELTDAKKWLEQQYQNYKLESEQKDKIIEELHRWTEEQEKAKVWLEQQYNNYKVESEQKDKIIEELKAEKKG